MSRIAHRFLTCANTGKQCTAETAKKKYKDCRIAEWTYVVSYKKDNPEKKVWTREDDVEQQVIAALETLSIRDKGYLQDILSWIANTNEIKKDHHKKHTATLKKEHTDIEVKLDKLMDLRINGELSKDEFMAMKKKLKDRQYEITDLVHAYDVTDDEFANRLSYLIKIAAGAADGFKGSGINEKRELLNFVFGLAALRVRT